MYNEFRKRQDLKWLCYKDNTLTRNIGRVVFLHKKKNNASL